MAWARISRGTSDGRPTLVKATDYDARLEADGLRALAAAGGPVPALVDVDAERMVMEEVAGPPDWEHLGRSLARVHATTAEAYGYHTDNVLGPLAQPNPWTPQWADFYARHRLRPHLEHVPEASAGRIEAAIRSGALEELLEHGQQPSLVHGDLWAGNVVEGRWLIDPAVHFADRELDRAFADLFGGIPASMWEAYEEIWPFDEGRLHRRPALQLYHLLVHVRLFGGGYAGMVADRLDRLGW